MSGCCAVGSAPALGAGGREFESRHSDHKDAWERYLKLVRRAGLASYTELLETAGLKVPFEDGSIKGIAQQMTDWLEAHQV